MAFSTHDLRRIRSVHMLRLDRAPRRNRRTGEPAGAPYALTSLGAFLTRYDAIDGQTLAESDFNLDETYYVRLAGIAGVLEEGERFAAVILDDLRVGGDGMSIRCPVKRIERPAFRRAA